MSQQDVEILVLIPDESIDPIAKIGTTLTGRTRKVRQGGLEIRTQERVKDPTDAAPVASAPAVMDHPRAMGVRPRRR